jgi:hypothetical protein
MEDSIKVLASIAEELDQKGLTPFADRLDSISSKVLSVKIAQYVGSQGYASRPGGRRRRREISRYATACFERSSYTINTSSPLSMKYSAIETPAYGAMYASAAGSDAPAETITV